MCPPEQSTASQPLKIGATYYLKRLTVFHRCVLKSFHDWQQTASVAYYASGDPVICRQSALLTEDQYLAILKQRRQEAYERDAPKRLVEAREKYREAIAHWEAGRRTAKDMCESSRTGTVRGWGQMIAAAKRWGLIKMDEEPK